jgi:hypothetical protein
MAQGMTGGIVVWRDSSNVNWGASEEASCAVEFATHPDTAKPSNPMVIKDRNGMTTSSAISMMALALRISSAHFGEHRLGGEGVFGVGLHGVVGPERLPL